MDLHVRRPWIEVDLKVVKPTVGLKGHLARDGHEAASNQSGVQYGGRLKLILVAIVVGLLLEGDDVSLGVSDQGAELVPRSPPGHDQELKFGVHVAQTSHCHPQIPLLVLAEATEQEKYDNLSTAEGCSTCKGDIFEHG